MNITIISNYLNLHQISICNELLKYKNISLFFVATQQMSDERQKLGYDDLDSKFSFVIRTYLGQLEYKKALEVCSNSDVIILGINSIDLLKNVKKDVILFKMSEHFQKDINFIKKVGRYFKYKKIVDSLKKYNYYLLSASYYSAIDYNVVGIPLNKSLNWGYFPNVEEYADRLYFRHYDEMINFLWVGRFLNWKNPFYCFSLAKSLIKEHIKFKITMIGDGPLKEKINSFINKNNLSNYIIVKESMPHKSIVLEMQKADIFLFTSNHHEGWGAVLNEALSAGCIALASKSAGSSQILINEERGFLFNGKHDFLNIAKKISKNIDSYACIGCNAQKYMRNVWNSKIACYNLLKQVSSIQNNKKLDESVFGPGSIYHGK